MAASDQFERIVEEADWQSVDDIVQVLDEAGYWSSVAPEQSAEDRRAHVLRHIRNLRGVDGIPVFLVAAGSRPGEILYKHQWAATSDDFLRYGAYQLAQSTRAGTAPASDGLAVMTMREDGRLVIRPEGEAPEDEQRLQRVLDHLQGSRGDDTVPAAPTERFAAFQRELSSALSILSRGSGSEGQSISEAVEEGAWDFDNVVG